MVSDVGYARPRDPFLSETTRTKHSRHHLTSNFNMFAARAVPSTKSKPPIIVIHVRYIYIYIHSMLIMFQCTLTKPAAVRLH